MADIVKHGSRYYSISDPNSKQEYVVIKVRLKKDNTRVTEDIRIIEAPNMLAVKTLIRTRPFKLFRKLPHDKQEFNPDTLPTIIQ